MMLWKSTKLIKMKVLLTSLDQQELILLMCIEENNLKVTILLWTNKIINEVNLLYQSQ